MGLLPAPFTQPLFQQPAPRLHPSQPGAPPAKPSERGRGLAEAVGAPRVWTYLCNYLQNWATEVTAPHKPGVEMLKREHVIQEYTQICKLVLYYCGSIHAILLMHIYKFKLALCYCESIRVLLITHTDKFQLVLYYCGAIYVLLITPIQVFTFHS